jgi:hypothetical protein
MLHDRMNWRGPVTAWITILNLITVFLVVGPFVAVWVAAAAH